jgi:hypothetical protein
VTSGESVIEKSEEEEEREADIIKIESRSTVEK